MKMLNFFKHAVLFLTLILPFGSVFSAPELIFSAPPRESKDIGIKIYQPVAKYLSQLLNRKVTYQHPRSWFDYQSNIRKDKYDIVFDGPHFTSWRIAHTNYEVLLKLPQTLQFLVVADINNIGLNNKEDLIGKRFCGLSPPNLSSLTFLAAFSNPVLQPKVKGIKGGMDKVHETFTAKKCSAAVLSNVFYNKKLNESQRNKLKVLFTSKVLPNQAISASSRVSAKEKKTISDALLKGAGAVAVSGIVQRFGGKKVKSFVSTNNKEYQSYNKYLEGVIFGW